MTNYIGLMSGTSIDGIDAVAISIENNSINVLGTHSLDWPTTIKTRLFRLAQGKHESINEYGKLHIQCGKIFGIATRQLLEKYNWQPSDFAAIGSHGQTIRHRPNRNHSFSLQIGDPSTIAETTGITTIADFRSRDMAAGGQGAPLVPAFHQFLFQNPFIHRVICNIGGIANITVLPANNGEVIGFDTGPGNTLLDNWIQKVHHKPYDIDGTYSSAGNVSNELLSQLKKDQYFSQPHPKSTGPEYFNLGWLTHYVRETNLKKDDLAATLAQLTCETIADAIKQTAPHTSEVYLCGGGAHNPTITEGLSKQLPHTNILSTEKLNLAPDWVEATCFAWLAHQTLQHNHGNLPSVTGAKGNRVLGGIFLK